MFAYWYFQIRSSSGPLKPEETSIGLAISVGFTVASAILALQITISEFEDRVKSDMKKIKDEFIEKQKSLLSGRAKILKLRDREVDDLIISKTLKSRSVKNTMINMVDVVYSDNSNRSISKMYANFMSHDDRKWIDISTVSDVQSGRYQSIKPQRIGRNTKHEVAIVGISSRVINFMLLESEKATDVFFGWVPDDTGSFEVFWTNDPSIIGLFSTYYKALYQSRLESFEVQYFGDELIESKIDYFKGTWLSVPKIDRMNKVSRFSTYSIINVSIVEGAWKVRIDIYNSENSVRVRVIESSTTIVDETQFFFEGESRTVGGAEKVTTFGRYRIAEDYEDVLMGTYVGEDTSTVHNSFAVKIPNQNLTEFDFETMKPVIGSLIAKKDLTKSS